MKKILLMTVGLIVSLLGASAQTVQKSIDFAADPKPLPNLSSYTSQTISNDGFWEVFAFNNNNNSSSWSDIRCGRKNATSSPYITTKQPLDVEVDYIDVTFSSLYKPDLLTEARLQTSTSSNFTSVYAEQDIKSKIIADQTVRFELKRPAKNLYYRLKFETASDSENGKILTIKKIELIADDNKKDFPDLSFPELEYSVVLNDLFITPELYNPEGVEVVYSSSDEDVATVDPVTGAITEIKKRGNTTITATSIETDKYDVSVAEYELYVTLPLAGIHYHEESYVVEEDAVNVFPTLINPNNVPVKYASSNEKVATINSNGEITIIGTGTTRISASYTENDEDTRIYEDCEVDYILTVVDSRKTYTFDMVNNTYGFDLGGSAAKYLPDGAKIVGENVTITYHKGVNSQVQFLNGGLRITKEGSSATKGAVLSIEVPRGYYIASITTSLEKAMNMAFNDDKYTNATSHSWTNSNNDQTISKVDYVSYTTSNQSIQTITVDIKPLSFGLTSGGYFTEPVEVLASGNVADKKVTVYYADGTVEEKGNIKSFTLNTNATVTATSNDISLSETYVFNRVISSLSEFNIVYDENANAYAVSGEVYFSDETEDKTDNYKDIYPDAYHLYVNGVDMGCWDSDDESIELTNIMPDAKFEVAVVKNDMNFVSSNIFQVVDITDQIEWIWPDNAKEAQDMNLKMVLKNGATHFVNHTVVENVPHVFSAMRLGLEEGKVSDLLNLPVEFVVHEATHEQGRFVITPNVDADTEGDAYEIHYSVEHVGKHESIEDFYASAESTQSVSATIGLRFVADAPATPAAAIRRAPGEAVPTQVYVNENNRTEVPSFSFAANNSEMSGIEDVAVDATEAVEYFNLQGIRLGAEPASGLYIRRQGGIATKVVR